MIVEVIAYTEIDYDKIAQMGFMSEFELAKENEPPLFLPDRQGVGNGGREFLVTNPEWEKWHEEAAFPSSTDELGEVAGRLCYLSWDRPNPATARNRDYLRNILNQQHYSVLEHSSVTFYLGGVSRSFTHELVRHRHLSFSQVSQRYVDESETQVVIPPEFDQDPIATSIVRQVQGYTKGAYRELMKHMEKKGVPRKQARQAARSVLPNANETSIVVTGNLRAWREFFQKRVSPAADKEIHKVAKRMLDQILVLAPNTFQDLKELQ